MSSKLAWHFQTVPGWAAGVVNSEWVKVMDPPAQNLFPAQRTIGRLFVPDNESNAMVMRGAAGGEEWFERCYPGYTFSPWVWCWEGPNEPAVETAEQRAALVAFTRRWVDLMHGSGHRTVALCLSTGWPDIGKAPELAGALEKTDYWAVHEYSAPTMLSEEGWECLRHERTIEELRQAGARIPPLLITECGIDGGVVSRPKTGWKTFGTKQQYLGQLAWFDGRIQRNPHVLAATIFTSGPNWDWCDFDVDEALSHDLAGYIDSQRSTAPAPTAFSQRDPRWAGQQLGTGAGTIGQAGCLLTCAASVLVDLAHVDMDPGRLNAWLLAHSGYVSEDLYAWRAVEPLGLQLVHLVDCKFVPAPVAEMRAALACGQAVIAEVDAVPGGAIDQHWVRILAIDEDGRDASIMDPWRVAGGEISRLGAYEAAGWDVARAVMAVAIYR